MSWFHLRAAAYCAAVTLLLLAAVPQASADAALPEEVVYVTNTKNSGIGSLRQAILDANANPGKDRIRFKIERGTGVRRIRPRSPLPEITDPVVIDGYTQPGASHNTLPDGNNAVLLIELDGTRAGKNTHGLVISAGSSTVRGLIINAFDGNGIWIKDNGGNNIKGNWIGVNAAGDAVKPNRWSGIEVDTDNNTIGGSAPGDRNVISGNLDDGIDLFNPGPGFNSVLGNFIGPARDGVTVLPNPAFGADATGNAGGGVYVQGPNNIIGGTTPGARNVISGNGGRFGGAFDSGVMLEGAGATGNIVQGNYLGANASGYGALGNYQVGVMIVDAAANTIGGSVSGAGNVISANLQDGIQIFNTVPFAVPAPARSSARHARRSVAYIASLPAREAKANRGGRIVVRPELGSTGNLIQGNFIGTGALGKKKLPNEFDGVFIFQGAQSNTVGGALGGEGNKIAHNRDTGVDIRDGGSTGNSILGNRIFKNAELGIDLAYNGPTANDTQDPDLGPNQLQNFPVLDPVSSAAALITGSLNSAPNTTFRVEFFRAKKCDANGYGEGQIPMGAVDVTTDGNGDAAISFAPTGLLRVGHWITATATDPAGNTSEFSACAAIQP